MIMYCLRCAWLNSWPSKKPVASALMCQLPSEYVVNCKLKLKQLEQTITSRFVYVPGKVYTPKRANKTKGYVAGAPMTKLLDFNPTSRQHIAWALQNFRGARFTKVTDTGKPKVDEATMSEMRDTAIQQGNEQAS